MKKISLSPSFLRTSIQAIAKSSVVALLSLVLVLTQARAAILIWDPVTGTPGAQDGSGTWNTVLANWYNPTTAADQTFTAADSAVFGAGGAGGTVTLGTVTAGSVSFGSFTGTYTLTAGGLTLNGDAGYIPSNYIAGQSGTNYGTVGLYVGTTAGTVTINSPLTVANAQSWINDSAGTVTLGGGVTYTGALTFGGGSFLLSGAGSGAGGATLTAGTVALSNAAAFGTGTLALNGGRLTSSSTTAYTLANTLAIGGSATFGDFVNNGALTFSAATQTINGLSGQATLTNLSGQNGITNTVTFGTGLTWGANTVTFKGPGQFGLQSTAASTGAVNIGDFTTGTAAAPVSAGSLGGRVSISTQAALGTGPVTLNYGGTLVNTGAFSPSNVFTINNGGTYQNSTTAASTAFASGSVINSGATITNTVGSVLNLSTANVTLPSAGALFFNTSTNNSGVAIAGSYPTPTGTLVFGGLLGNAANNSNQVTTTAATLTGNTTLGFNKVGFGSVQLNGVTLGGNLTLAGGSVSTLSGAVPQSYTFLGQGTDNLGIVTETGGARSITVNMSPIGQIGLGGISGVPNTAYTGGTTINSGYLTFVGYNNSSPAAAKFAGGASSTGVTLNGGWFRITGNNGSGASSDNFAVGVNGGGLDSFGPNAASLGQSVTFSGNVTASGAGGPLTLRYGGQGGTGTSLILSGNNSTFAGGYTLATTNAFGRIQFSGVNSLGTSGNVITAPAGVAFGFDAVNAASLASLQTAVNHFSTSAGSILTLENFPTNGIVDLSNSGGTSLNRDVRIGSATNLTYQGTITPFGTSYNFTPTSGATLTLNQFEQLTDGLAGSNSLDVAAGVQAPGANGVATGTLQVTNTADFTGATTVNGTTLNSIGAGGTTGTNLLIGAGGDLSLTSSVTVDKNSTLRLAGPNGGIGISSGNIGITVKGGGAFLDGDATVANNNNITNRIAATDSLTLGGSTGGGTFTLVSPATGTHAQTLNSLTVATGANTLNPGTAATGSATLTLGGTGATNYVRNSGGTLSIVQQGTSATATAFAAGASTVTFPTGLTNVYVGMPISGTGLAGATYVTSYNSGTGALGLSQPTVGAGSSLTYTVSTNSVIFTNTPGSASVVGGVLVGTLINGNDFATTNGSGALSVAAYTYQSAAGSWGAGQNISTLGNTNFSGTTPTTLIINSLRSGSTGNATVAIGTTAASTLTISTGMISATPNATLTIAGPGSLLTGNGQDYFVNVTQNADTISAKLGSTAALTKLGGGTLSINNTANTITDTNIYGGSVIIGGGVTALGTGGAINLFGGALQVSSGTIPTATFSNAYSLNVGPQAGNALQTTGSSTLNFNGNIALNGRLTVSAETSATFGTINLGGTISGAGTLLAQGSSANSNFGSKVTISGANPNWTGGLMVSNGQNTGPVDVFLGSATAAGTGPIIGNVGTGKGAALYFAPGAAGTFANSITGVPSLNNQATSGPVTLTGGVYSTGGLNLQGYAAGGAASETVLAGTTATSGVPLSYNFSATPAATVQNFVNGQGGITVGSTDYGFNSASGNNQNTQLSTASSYFFTMSVDSPGGGKLTQGALGFVRFNGANSFLPGAVGPGYLAALHKGGDTAVDYGNGVLTGTSGTTTGGANGLFGFRLTGSGGAGTTYTMPEGKSFLIGTLGGGLQTGGTLGVSGGTATLVGGPKAAAGQLLAGYTGGDVNIHANAAADTQSLNLEAAGAGSTFNVGATGGGAASAVVFTPTYGDSGYTSSVTLLSQRTGLTTINKVGTGTVSLNNVAFTNTSGTDASTGFVFNVNAGTLKLAQGGGAAGVSGGTLRNAPTVTINGGGTLLVSSNNALGTATAVNLNGGTYAVSNGAFEGTGARVTGANTLDPVHNARTGGAVASGTNTTGVGILTLTAPSTLDFGTTGVSTQVFAGFNGLSLTNTLNIVNYTSVASFGLGVSGTEGTDDRLIYSGTELTAAQLSFVTFNGVANAGQIDLTGGYFEIVSIAPVPEPSTMALCLLVGVIGYRGRKHFVVRRAKLGSAKV